METPCAFIKVMHSLVAMVVNDTCMLIIAADQKAKMVQKAKRASHRNSGKKKQ